LTFPAFFESERGIAATIIEADLLWDHDASLLRSADVQSPETGEVGITKDLLQ